MTYRLFVLMLIMSFCIGNNAFAAGRKCCYNHGGIKRCDGVAKHLCNDGYIGNCPKHNH